MNLLGIRQQFCNLSGRHDLATDDGGEDFDTDNGADFFINSGMRFLDRKYRTKKSTASHFQEIGSGDFYITFQNCFSVEEVWCNNNEGRWKVQKYPYQDIREAYTGLVSASDGGSPSFYHPIWLRADVNSEGYDDLGEFFSYVENGEDGTYNGILFTPKADDKHLIEVIGRFLTSEMVNNNDTNYWTNVAPEILLKSALRQLEIFYRNTEGANDWLKSMDMEAIELEKDLVEEESNDAEVLE